MTISGKARSSSMKRRTKKRSQRRVVRLDAARKHRMKPKKKPISVATRAMLMGLDHLVDIFRQVEAFGDVMAALDIVELETAVLIGARQVEQGAPDLHAVARHQITDEIEEVRQAIEELAGIGGVGEPQRAAEGDGEQQNTAPGVEAPLEGEFFPVALDGAALLRQGDRWYRGCHDMDPKSEMRRRGIDPRRRRAFSYRFLPYARR